jgi:hypothetical protein
MTRVRLNCVLVGLAGAFTVATAAAQEPPLPGLSWQAPEGCPQAAALRERVRAITSPSARESRLQAAGEITKAEGRFHLKLVVRDGGLVGERNITSDLCEDLAGAAAVALGLLLRSETPLTERELSGAPASDSAAVTEPGAPASKTPSVAEAPTPTPTPIRQRAAASRRLRALLRAPAISVEFGPLPQPSLGLGLGAGVSYENWRVLLAGALWLEQSLPAPNRPGYGADATRKSLALSVGRGFEMRDVELVPCITMGLEHLSARGFGSDVMAHQRSAVWLSAGAGLLIAWHFASSVALVADVGARVQASRPLISIDGLGDVRQLAPLSFGSVVAAEWSF